MIRPSIFDQTPAGMMLRSRLRCRAFGVVPSSSAIRFSVTLSWPDSSPSFSAVAMVILRAALGGRRWLFPVVTERRVDRWDALQGCQIKQREVPVHPSGGIDVIDVAEDCRLTQRGVPDHHRADTCNP